MGTTTQFRYEFMNFPDKIVLFKKALKATFLNMYGMDKSAKLGMKTMSALYMLYTKLN